MILFTKSYKAAFIHLTDYMEQSPWEANICSIGQEIPSC